MVIVANQKKDLIKFIIEKLNKTSSEEKSEKPKKSKKSKKSEKSERELLLEKSIEQLKAKLEEQKIKRGYSNLIKNNEKEKLVDDLFLSQRCSPENEEWCSDDKTCDIRNIKYGGPGICRDKADLSADPLLIEEDYEGHKFIGSKDAINKLKVFLQNKKPGKQEEQEAEEAEEAEEVEEVEEAKEAKEAKEAEEAEEVEEAEQEADQEAEQEAEQEVEQVPKKSIKKKDIDSVLKKARKTKVKIDTKDLSEIQKQVFKCLGIV